VVRLVDRMASELSTLREDILVELPGARGETLAAQASRTAREARHMQKAVRGDVSPKHLGEHAQRVAQELRRFLREVDALGERGEFLSRSARRLREMDRDLLQLLRQPAARP